MIGLSDTCDVISESFNLGKAGTAIPGEDAFIKDLVLDPVHQVVDVIRG